MPKSMPGAMNPSYKGGILCKVCGKRDPSMPPGTGWLLCRRHRDEQAPCPVCGELMPRYGHKGEEKKCCGNRCRNILSQKSHTSEAQRAAALKRYAGHVRVTPEMKRIRRSSEYRTWRTAVFVRDDYTCQKCGARNAKGIGRTVRLNAHHIQPFATHPERRFDTSNGITLCEDCHELPGRALTGGRPRQHRDERVIVCACGCNQTLTTPAANGRERMYINGHNRRKQQFPHLPLGEQPPVAWSTCEGESIADADFITAGELTHV